MVEQAVRQTYTYYSPSQPEGEVVEDTALNSQGRAWTLGTYRHPTYPSPLNVRVGDAGIKVWMVILWLRLCADDLQVLRERYGDILEEADVEAAKWYYERHKEWIDPRLEEEAQIA